MKQKGFIKTSNALKQFGNVFLNKAQFAIEKVDDLYLKLHFAVYLGNVTEVEELVTEEFIDFESVDKYNPILPLNFAVTDGLLHTRLLIEKTEWIRSIYNEETI